MGATTISTRFTTATHTTLLGLAILATIVTAGAGAQSLPGTRIESGLHTFPPLHLARVTVAQLGGTRAATLVTIELRDENETVVASRTGYAKHGEPLRLDFRLPAWTQLRATVTTHEVAGLVSRPSTTLEDVDLGSFTAIPKGQCGPPAGRGDPQTSCPGWDLGYTQ